MTKISSHTALAILRKFGIAHDDNSGRQVEFLVVTQEDEFSTVAQFRFLKRQYIILCDSTIEDDTAYASEKLVSASDRALLGEFIKNPNDDEVATYALPFKGKEYYLFAQKSLKKRIDLRLAEAYPDISRATWQKYIKAGFVTIDGTPTLSPKQEILESAKLSVEIPAQTDFSKEEFPIIYMDDSVIVIDKPIGVLTHKKGALNDEFSVADFFGRYTKWTSEDNREGIVHRLDRDTSGVIIGAKNEQVAAFLQKQFAGRTVQKTYIAVLSKVPAQKTALVDVPIGRNPSAPSQFRADAKGKTAQTTYRILATNAAGQALVEFKPKTGRTHQLRVHAAYLGTPIVGDRVYGKNSGERLFLHAHKLEIAIPDGSPHGVVKQFVSEIPEIFLAAFPDFHAKKV